MTVHSLILFQGKI